MVSLLMQICSSASALLVAPTCPSGLVWSSYGWQDVDTHLVSTQLCFTRNLIAGVWQLFEHAGK